MIAQTVKMWSLLWATAFTAIALFDYFHAGNIFGTSDMFPLLIVTAFIGYLAGEIIIFKLEWHLDRRKLELTKAERENWMFNRQAD